MINYATGAKEGEGGIYYVLIAIIGIPHLVILFLIVLGEKPLAQYLYEYDDLIEVKKDLELNLESELQTSTAFNDTLFTASATLVQIDSLPDNLPENKEQLLTNILTPWVDQRFSIFFFRDGDAFYNFAVYLFNDSTKRLEKAYRAHDNRLTPHNRSWRVGDGHVGQCFVQERTIFLSFPQDSLHTDAVQTTQFLETDTQYYQSMVAAPLTGKDNQVNGVLIVTSSKKDQFIKEIHTQIVDLLALLVSESLKRYDGYKKSLETTLNEETTSDEGGNSK